MKIKTSIYLIILIVVLGLIACMAPTEKTFDTQLAKKLQAVQVDSHPSSTSYPIKT